MAGQLGDVKEQLTLLDVENSKITNRCEVLHQLNLSLEEDRKSLMSQVLDVISSSVRMVSDKIFISFQTYWIKSNLYNVILLGFLVTVSIS